MARAVGRMALRGHVDTEAQRGRCPADEKPEQERWAAPLLFCPWRCPAVRAPPPHQTPASLPSPSVLCTPLSSPYRCQSLRVRVRPEPLPARGTISHLEEWREGPHLRGTWGHCVCEMGCGQGQDGAGATVSASCCFQAHSLLVWDAFLPSLLIEQVLCARRSGHWEHSTWAGTLVGARVRRGPWRRCW